MSRIIGLFLLPLFFAGVCSSLHFYGYMALFILLFGYYWAPDFLSFEKLLPLPWIHYRHDKFRRAQQDNIFTVFIQGASGQSVPLLANQFTTSKQVIQQLSAHGYVPYDNQGILMLTTSARRILLPGESLHNAGLGALSHLWLQIRVLRGMQQEQPRKWGKKTPGKAMELPETMETDADGMLKDITVQDIEEITEGPSKQNKIHDIEHFFGQLYIDSDGKRVQNCTICTKKAGMPKAKVNELSTLRRHCQSFHKATYQKWAKDNGFALMLPDDHKELKAAKMESEQQTCLHPHLKE
ncbi:uncharacterized protein EV420DRAFT_1482363 [Desarmillaria tabescens]|uniref:Uncharacterized protein n=1 Tax=Armillaria tabescens TaxID=1929756 RepID=A0AA39K234_ARMTA|nr:uncharacterized protein EV420DRAFT_1482363 [Desarmillaria tabescens]KAK0452025.1 hypothetical protein EV420DRAFT_1482363 [Desarmillaria tabescens]